MNIRFFLVPLASLAAAALAGCGSDVECGPGDAPPAGIEIASADLTTTPITYGDATTSPNNDCSVDEAPTSLTIDIAQVDPVAATRRAFILCVPRPDNLEASLALTDDSVTTGVQVIDIFADDGDCLISLDRSRPVSGTATFTGACEDGTDAAGYALRLEGQIPATATCPGGASAITLTLSGEAAVTAL